jgi:hypothetical protein
MNRIALLLLVCGLTQANAQVTLTRTDFTLQPNSAIYRTFYDPNSIVSFPTIGPNQVWDFSSLITLSSDTLTLSSDLAKSNIVKNGTFRSMFFNCYFFNKNVGSPQYDAILKIISRVNPDVICVDEVGPLYNDFKSVANGGNGIADSLGYPYITLLSSYKYGSFVMSKYPFKAVQIIDAAYARSMNPTNAANTNDGLAKGINNGLGNGRVTIELNGVDHIFYFCHLFPGRYSSPAGKLAADFQRWVQMYRIMQDVDIQRAISPTAKIFIQGDMNEWNGSDKVVFTSFPDSAVMRPGDVIGADINGQLPIYYSKFPQYLLEQHGFTYSESYNLEGDKRTFWPYPENINPVFINNLNFKGSRIDYNFASSNTQIEGKEIYDGNSDANTGLPKSGTPLLEPTGSISSDHKPVFMDINLYRNTYPNATTAYEGTTNFITGVLSFSNDNVTYEILNADTYAKVGIKHKPINMPVGVPYDSLSFIENDVIFPTTPNYTAWFPMNYLDSKSSEYIDEYFFMKTASFGLGNDKVRIKSASTTDYKVAGWGDLILKNPKNQSIVSLKALLMEVMTSKIDSFFQRGIPADLTLLNTLGVQQGQQTAYTAYRFFAKGFSSPVLTYNEEDSKFWIPSDLGPTNTQQLGVTNIPFRCYPNPVIDHLNIEFEKASDEPWIFSIYNSLGQKVIDKELSQPIGEVNESIQLIQDLQDGYYFYILWNESRSVKSSGGLLKN